MKRSIFLTATLTLATWYSLFIWDLVSGSAPLWLAPTIKELIAFQNGIVLLAVGLLPLLLFGAWVNFILDKFALQKMADEIKRAQRKRQG